MQSLVTFSHLRWDFVYQRPQHLMTRLAQHYRVFFFEEPVLTDGRPRLEIIQVAPNLVLCRPHTAIAARGFHDDQLPVLQLLLEDLLSEQEIRHPVVWLYTPMALPLLQRLEASAIVYDCMDELSAFLNAPRQLLQRESALLKAASVVFTGGPSLYRSKRGRHPSVHCMPSSVDRDHFGRARDPSIETPQMEGIAHPRLGFFGVIDERLDLNLVADLAEARPRWQIVMVGPVVKIDPTLLPKRSNIHYFGQQQYADLPRFLAGWDACLLPFALNEATRFISPTKTLEYMAAETLIVSTPVADVVEPYGDVVYSATGYDFVKACDQAIEAPQKEREHRFELMRSVVARTSWDATATRMHELIQEACALQAAPPPVQRAAKSEERAATHDVVIIGAGPTGLSAAYHVGESALLLEQNETVGGWCRSIEDRGFTFDHAGHIMFSKDPYVLRLYRMLLGNNMHWQDREAWIYSQGVHTRYPFQGALYGLPPDVLTECITGAIEARFGPLGASPTSSDASNTSTPPRAVRSSTTDCKAESITDCCADGIAEATAPLSAPVRLQSRDGAPANFEDFIYKVWGAGVAKHFAIPYNRKLWAVPLTEMETSWLGGRVPIPDLQEMIEGALRPSPKPMGPNARFGYPLKGGFQALVEGFVPRLRGELKLGARVARVVPSTHTVVLADGSKFTYRQLISTMPLPVLVRSMGEEAPISVRTAAAGLRHVSVRCVNLGIGRAHLTDKHWIYYPEDSVFHRIFVQGNASPHCNPAGGFGLTCEITYSPHKPLPCEGEDLIDLCIRDCLRVGMIRPDDPILARNQVDMPYAYVVYDHARAAKVRTVRDWLLAQDIVLAGRYSEWEYYNSDHAFLAGKKAAETVTAKLGESGDLALDGSRARDDQAAQALNS